MGLCCSKARNDGHSTFSRPDQPPATHETQQTSKETPASTEPLPAEKVEPTPSPVTLEVNEAGHQVQEAENKSTSPIPDVTQNESGPEQIVEQTSAEGSVGVGQCGDVEDKGQRTVKSEADASVSSVDVAVERERGRDSEQYVNENASDATLIAPGEGYQLHTDAPHNESQLQGKEEDDSGAQKDASGQDEPVHGTDGTVVETDETEKGKGGRKITRVHSAGDISRLSGKESLLMDSEEYFGVDKDNYLFYAGRIKCRPDELFIDEIHSKWWQDYEILEQLHGFIQWLFPLFENSGVNYQAQKLERKEAELMGKSQAVCERFVKSYEMMLDFYGFELVNKKTGQLRKSANWKARFSNLSRNRHNNLRINRILLSLGYLGFGRYKKPFLDILRKVIYDERNLSGCKDSYDRFWSKTVDSEELPEAVYFHQFTKE